MKRLDVLLTGLGLIAGTFGCTDPGVSAPVAEEQSPVVNSQLSQSEDNGVVLVLGRGAGCTGTLIAPDVVLTALHCVSDYDSRFTFVCNDDGTLAPASIGGTLGPIIDPPSGVSVRVGVLPPTTSGVVAKAIYGTGAKDVCQGDIAIVVLEEPLDIGEAPLVKLRFDDRTQRRDLTRVLGYGDTSGTSTVNGRQERQHVPIVGVGGPDASTPGDKEVAPRTVMIGEGPCHGDSGGPLLAEDTGAQIGVYSLLVANTCVGTDVTNVYTHVASYESFIRESMAAVGEEPLVDPPPVTGAGGGAGATGQAGEPGGAGVPSEGGAPAETGGSSGAPSVGGSGGSGAVAGSATGTGGTGGSAPTTPRGTGSGSRRDSSCALRAAGRAGGDSRSLALFALVALTFARRRRR